MICLKAKTKEIVHVARCSIVTIRRALNGCLSTKILVPICIYCLKCMKFGQLFLRKVIKIDATRCAVVGGALGPQRNASCNQLVDLG